MANLVRISESASLALHAAALLARRPEERVPNQEIATTLHASVHHLAKVMQQLVRAGFICSTRGPKGGFQIKRSPEEITLLQVFEAVEGPLGDAECLLSEPVCDWSNCLLGELVHSVHQQVRQYLTETTLAQLAARFTPTSIQASFEK